MDIKRKDINQYLHAFNLITAKGKKLNDAYELGGLRAWHDFDGYTCWLSYQDLTMTLLFHGKYEISYEKEDTIDSFSKKVMRLLADDKSVEVS